MPRFLVIACLLSLASLQAQEYELMQPQPQIYTNLRASFTISAEHAVELGKIIDHPKIVWLDEESMRREDGPMLTEFGFLIRSPGTVKFPPIPVEIDGKPIFIRLDDLEAIENPAPDDLGRFTIEWNGKPNPPATVHLGEAIEVDFIGTMKQPQGTFPRFDLPISRIRNCDWHLFTRQPGRNARQEDYFYNLGQAYFPRRYLTEATEIDGQYARTRKYRSRLICSQLGEASGNLGLTLSSGQFARTYLIPFSFNVLPLPPLPNDRVVNTGLVGDWAIRSRISPSQITTDQPFEITVYLQGRGDPNLRTEFDFSRDGFRSVEAKFTGETSTNYDVWSGGFRQKLVPSGDIATYPAVTLASFDTTDDEWKLHSVTPTMIINGMADITKAISPSSTLGTPIQRPVLLNLPTATFGAFALAPFLPFLLGLLKKRLDQRDPARQARQQKARSLIADFKSGKASTDQLDTELLPLLREHLHLPNGASTNEVATTLEPHHPELAQLLHTHAQSSFSSNATGIDLKLLASRLAKVAFLFLLVTNLPAASLEEANQAYAENRYTDAISQYETLIGEEPGQPRLYQNLALAYLAIDDPARARAACHTALLLDPLDGSTRDLMDDIRRRLGAPELPGTRYLELRPDQWLVLSALFWIIGFLLIGLRHFNLKAPRFLIPAIFLLAVLFAAGAFWRNAGAYKQNQFMVLDDRVAREPEPGIPDWNYPALEGGQIIVVADSSDTHARIDTAGTSFWVPLKKLKQVW
ncbi:MAG: tetratricopeptide repeat protein [Verrucomicrobiaceae bacterium]